MIRASKFKFSYLRIVIMFSLNSKPNLCRFLLLFVYNSIAVGDAIVKRMGRVGILLTGLTPPQFCTCPMTGTGFIASYYVMVFFLCSIVWGQRWLFCSYLLYCWLSVSLFKLSLHTNVSKIWYIWLFLSEWLLFNTKLTIFQLYQSFDDKFLFKETNMCDL